MKRVPSSRDYAIDEDVARRRLHIMVVEDNVVNQKVAAAMLKKRGHSVVIASNGTGSPGRP